MVRAGLLPEEVEDASGEATHQDCRTCHQIHVTFTGEDWALETTDAVVLYAFEDATYDGGAGNLCANCHQPRRQIAEADADGNIEVTSTHWGPHHGPQAAFLLGLSGAGDVEGKASGHYSLVEDTCVACHLGEGDDHSFAPSVASCLGCHADIEDFDFSGLQTEVEEKLAELAEFLVAAGMWDEEEDHPVVGTYPAAQAQALWNYILISHEDESLGVHNPAYTLDLLEASLAAFE
jgi:cytochrome c2